MRNQKQRNRYYQSLSNKIELYGQSISSKERPTSKDVRRAEEHLSTIKEYEKIFRRYQRSVNRFNTTYLQDIELPIADDTIDKRKLNKLIKEYEEWKRWRRNWVRHLGDEYLKLMKTLIDYVKYCINGIKSDTIKNPKDIRIKEHLQRATTLLNALKFWKNHRKDGLEKAKRIKANWEELMKSIQIWIFNDSDGDARREAWLLVESTITGEEVTGDWTDFE